MLIRNAATLLALTMLPAVAAAPEEPGGEEGRYRFEFKGYTDTPLVPGTKWRVHQADRPTPRAVHAGTPGSAPSDAIILFDGKDLSRFKPVDWKIVDGTVQAGRESLVTQQAFDDCQLHIEWQTPDPPRGEAANMGNSGLHFMGHYELQVYDSFSSKIYADGSAAAIYGQTPPLVNATREPGKWQSYDIVFRAPVFEGGKLKSPARITVLHNGVLVQHNTRILGVTEHRLSPSYRPHAAKLPLVIQGHGSPVRFRNIWIRELVLSDENSEVQ